MKKFEGEFKLLAENERRALVAALAEKIGAPNFGHNGCGRSSEETAIFVAPSLSLGTRVRLAAIAKSDDGDRFFYVGLITADPAGDWALCDRADAQATRVAWSNLCVRPWAVQDEVNRTGGLGMVGRDAFAAALAAAGIE